MCFPPASSSSSSSKQSLLRLQLREVLMSFWYLLPNTFPSQNRRIWQLVSKWLAGAARWSILGAPAITGWKLAGLRGGGGAVVHSGLWKNNTKLGWFSVSTLCFSVNQSLLFAAKRYTRQVTHDLHLIAIGEGGFVWMQPRVQWALKILYVELSNKQSPIENFPGKIANYSCPWYSNSFFLLRKKGSLCITGSRSQWTSRRWMHMCISSRAAALGDDALIMCPSFTTSNKTAIYILLHIMSELPHKDIFSHWITRPNFVVPSCCSLIMQNACELCCQLCWIGFRSECFVSSCVSVTNDVSRVCTLTWVDENAVHGNVSIGAKRVKAVCIILHMCCDRQDQQGWEFFHKSKQTLATFLLLVYDITLAFVSILSK